MTEAPVKTTPSKDSLLKHLAEVEVNSAKNQAGCIGCNPFLWAKKNVAPLVEAVKAAKEVSPELAAKVLALKALEAPKPAAK